MNIKKVVETLHPLERKVLPFISRDTEIKDIIKKSGLKEVEVVRGIQWLQNKGIVKLDEEVNEIIELGDNGKKYLKEGLPEKKFLRIIKEDLNLEEIKKKSGLNNDEFSICLGTLKKKAAIELADKKISITKNGERILKGKTLEEEFLERLPLKVSSLTDEQRFSFNELKKRKDVVKLNKIKIKKVSLLDKYSNINKISLGKDYIEVLTPKMITDGSWKDKKFRRYDIKINVPKIYSGKRHFVNQAISYVKRVWLDMGFKEMTGSLIQTSFWNFDALFTAQDHPVREMHDTFFIKNPKYGKLPNNVLVERVKKTHENGWTTGSKGWGYKWDENEAKKNVLRTHTTCLSARTIATLKKKDLPAKFFSVGKCFRNETLDWSHLFELIQVEGIVVDPNANFRNLIGYLKEFFGKMGFPKIRVRPAYFPYTEPSAEIDVFHPIKKQWIELGGSGIFRPEMTKPLFGEEIPVLAWGLGLERSILDYYGIKDIREIYKNNLKQLKEIKLWMK
jgi:phenylalanyl-tRNA synthetase alpha chain